jgi:hypothetical protein
MNRKTHVLQSLALAALLASSTASQAAVGFYTTQSSFLANVLAPAVDTFAGFSTNDPTNSPITRSVGPYTYTATSPTGFYGAGAGSAGDPWLSTNSATDTITFANFGGGVRAIGGMFFGSDVSGDFTSGTIILTATDSLGSSLSETLNNATLSGFAGFTTNGFLTSLVVSSVSPGSTVWPTVDNLTVAAAIPEPETWALMLAGFGLLSYSARRRLR